MPVFRKNRSGFASETLKKHIFDVTRRWMDPDGDGHPEDGIDGWRLDVPSDIPRAHWEEWRKFVKRINPQAIITGEIWHRADQWLDGEHFDAVMNYEFAKVVVAWVFNRQQKITAREAASRLAELRLAYPTVATYALQNLVDGHDTDRLASMAQNPDREYDRQNRVQDNNPDYDNSKPSPDSYARARLVALLQMTYVGAPLIFYGDEAGMWGADDPSNRKPMLWKDLEPYEKPEENFVMPEHLAFYKQAVALRNGHSALRDGTFQTLLADDEADVWVFLRGDEQEHVLVALNASALPREVRVPLPEGVPTTWAVVFGDLKTVDVSGGAVKLLVPPISGVALQAAAK
jgi:cyclomaltodextrinase